MTVELNPQCRSRLVEVLRSVLANIVVEHGRFIRWSSFKGLEQGDEALPKGIRKQLAEWVTDAPFSTFMRGILHSRVYRAFEFQSASEAPLAELAGFENMDAVVEEMISKFESLPWHYTLLFDL